MPVGVHVAIAVIRDQQGRVLVAKRPASAHQGGKLEFPGGKVEVGESARQALQRELYEELGIRAEAGAMQPLIKINHHYADKSVCLDVWQVLEFSEQAYGKEGQPIFWLHADSLEPQDFPAANAPIITALNLPPQLMLSPDLVGDIDSVVAEIRSRIEQHDIQAAILRLPRIDPDSYAKIAEELVLRCPQVRWQIHSDIALARRLGLGVHIPAKTLTAIDQAQLKGLRSISASIHNMDELKQAQALAVSFAVLGPVQATLTHPYADSLGWAGFAELVDSADMPVYALGGLQVKDLPQALSCGAQGVAGIRLFTVK